MQLYGEKTMEEMVRPLLEWYKTGARDLPWRRDTDPYRVWISEIMLQQTRVEAVKPYYERFLKELPDIAHLAAVPEERLLKLWEGLGYYSRARNLQRAAQRICAVHGGVFPSRYEEILALPGIGEYTAGAVGSICFGLPVPAVDGNVLRVMARLTAYGEPATRPAFKKAVTGALGELYSTLAPPAQTGALTQSLMELGATVCLPNGAPLCRPACPLAHLCCGFAAGRQNGLPVKEKKAARRKENLTVFLLRYGGQLVVCRRQETGLLAGLWQLPNTVGHLTGEEARDWLEEQGVPVKDLRAGKEQKHVFTHVEWEMNCWEAECEALAPGWISVTEARLGKEIALPTAFRRCLESKKY